VGFEGTNDELRLTFQGFDIDFDDEIEFFLNGVSQGYLDAGVNNGFAEYMIDISAVDQIAGENVITFEQDSNPNWTWGVTDFFLTDIFII
jgi:hypothetical protein